MRPASGKKLPSEPAEPKESVAGNESVSNQQAENTSVATGSRASVTPPSRTGDKQTPLSLRQSNAPRVKAKVKAAESAEAASPRGRPPGRPPPPPPDDDRRKAHAQMMAARFNSVAETNEVRTLLKLPRDTPSAQVIHKLREAFHLTDIVERFRSDLGRLLHTKEARTAEGALRAVQELLRENEQLRQQVDHQQEVIAKLQEDRRAVLERFHKVVRENRIKDYGSGSLLALTGSTASDSRFQSQEQVARTAPATNSFSELTVTGTGERRDLATMLSSRIDHLLVPKTAAQGDNSTVEHKQQQQEHQQQLKELSPIYIRQKKNKDEKKLVYKITGIMRPASSASSKSSQVGRPRTMPAVSASLPSPGKLPEIVAKRRTPTPTHRVRMLVEGESIARPPSSLLSLTETSTTGTSTTTTTAAAATGSTTSGSVLTGVLPRRAVRSQGPFQDRRRADSNLVSISKRYSSSALSATGSLQQPMAAPPSSVQEQDEQSIGDLFGSISDVKKDDLVSLIFAPLLKDRYISRFTISPQGGVLSIPEVGLSLVVPEGALPPTGAGAGNGEVDIILGVSYNPADTPTISATHTVPCPSILCTTRPARLHFRRPVALVFAHSGGGPVLAKTRSTPRILHSLTEIGHVTRWEAFSSIEQSDTEEDGEQCPEAEEEFGCVNGEHCILFLNQLRLFSLVTEHGSGGGGGVRTATKYVRVVVFVSYSPGRDSVALNVYCTDSLPSERQLLRRECLLDGTGVEVGEQPMVMYANSGDLLVSVRNIPIGWQLHGQSHQSVSYRKAWHNLHPHVTFLVECAPDTWESELTCSIHAQQVNADDADASADIHICCDLAQMEGCSDGSLFDNATSTGGLRSFLRGQAGGFFSPSVFDAGGSLLLQDADVDSVAAVADDVRTLILHAAWPRVVHDRRVPDILARQLVATLDPPNLLGLDWRQLAAELNLDACVPHLRAAGRPTGHLLAAAELLCAGLYELEAVLVRMGRDDAAALIRAHRARTTDVNTATANQRAAGGRGLPVTARF